MNNATIIDTMVNDALTDAFNHYHMMITAENAVSYTHLDVYKRQYYYSVYGSENEAVETNPQKKVLVLGSGPIRIGQGIEFDFCSVHCKMCIRDRSRSLIRDSS